MVRVKPADVAPAPVPEAFPVVPLTTRPGSVEISRASLSREGSGRPPSEWACGARLRRTLTPVLRSRFFRVTMVGTLVFALFGGCAWSVLDVPDDPGIQVLDALMSAVTVLFAMEIVVNWVVDYREYPLSFFFLTDLLGTVSMMFEISFLLGSAGKVQRGKTVNTLLMRTARAAKVGARVGRLSKLVKCLSMFYKGRGAGSEGDAAEAKVLSERLMLALSTKVSLLTILLVLIVPLFQIGQYPEEDLSMQAWAQRLEIDFQRALEEMTAGAPNTTDAFGAATAELVDFYSSMNYRPYRLEGYSAAVGIFNVVAPGASILHGADPVRKQNIYVLEAADVLVDRASGPRPALYFDFTKPNQVDSGMDIAMILFIILVMAVVSFNLSSTLDSMVVKPLERMLGMVKSMAGNLLRQFGVDEDQEEGETNAQGCNLTEETALLESIFRKFARLAALAAAPNVACEEDLADVDDEGKGVLMEMMNMKVAPSKDRHTVAFGGRGTIMAPATVASIGPGALHAGASLLPVPREVVESWDLDVLELDSEGLKRVVVYIFFDSAMSEATGRAWTELNKFHRFHQSVRAGYNDLPYHCYAHACDVLHTIYRVLTITHTEQWLSDMERYAMLIAALCHDVGHQGKTNPFLVETKHELALRYNDKSPLENMHCARLFEICSAEETDIFDKAPADCAKQARKVCISAILKTDNAAHFEMVKEISRAYEVNSELCELQAQQPGDLTLPYLEQVLHKNPLVWMELFLHLADVSNPLKPFKICKVWAWRILDEFFAQGDEEKRLGIPVGMLNDREKINRPGSQHGFINFLVAPLVTVAVKIFPPLHPLSTQMASNLETWRNMWVEDAKPSPEDVAKRDIDVQKIKDAAANLRHRS